MKRTIMISLAIVFFAFVAVGLVTYVCLTCHPDTDYRAKVQQAFLASTEGEQDSQTK